MKTPFRVQRRISFRNDKNSIALILCQRRRFGFFREKIENFRLSCAFGMKVAVYLSERPSCILIRRVQLQMEAPVRSASRFNTFDEYREIFMKHPVDVHVGKRIRQQRWMNSMTQQQLADAIGIKFQQIQKYETGMNRVSASRLWDISRALDVPVEFFFEGLGSRKKPAEPASKGLVWDRDAAHLMRAYNTIPERQRRKLVDLARVLSDEVA